MTSVQRKFAAGIISLFIILSAHYLGQTTRLTPAACAEPIYEFTQYAKAGPTPITRSDVDCLKKKAEQQGIKLGKVSSEVKKGSDGKRFREVSGKIISSTVSEYRVNEIVKALVNKCTGDNLEVVAKLVR